MVGDARSSWPFSRPGLGLFVCAVAAQMVCERGGVMLFRGLPVVDCPIGVAVGSADLRRAFVCPRGSLVRSGGAFEALHGSLPCGHGRGGRAGGAFAGLR